MITFVTANGSVYEVDEEKKSWRRVSKSGESGSLREEGGNLLRIIRLAEGESALLQDDKVLPGANFHLIMTSPVVSIVREGEDVGGSSN